MARSRNIKPGFFTNEELAEVVPLGRLLFAGLWTIADRAGRLEDRPRRIKAELLPYDDCDVEGLLAALADRGFVQRYRVGEAAYIQITTFSVHQRPHSNESNSAIPEPPDLLPKDEGLATKASSAADQGGKFDSSEESVTEETTGENPDDHADLLPRSAGLATKVSSASPFNLEPLTLIPDSGLLEGANAPAIPPDDASARPVVHDSGAESRSAGEVYALVDAFVDGKGLARGDLVGRARKTAYTAMANAPPWVAPRDVHDCTSYFMTDPFWAEPRKLTAQVVVEGLPEWRNKGRPAAVAAVTRGERDKPTASLDPAKYKGGKHLHVRGS